MKPPKGASAEIAHMQLGNSARTSFVDQSRWVYDGSTWKLQDYAGVRRGAMYAKELPIPLPVRVVLEVIRRRMNRQRHGNDLQMV